LTDFGVSALAVEYDSTITQRRWGYAEQVLPIYFDTQLNAASVKRIVPAQVKHFAGSTIISVTTYHWKRVNRPVYQLTNAFERRDISTIVRLLTITRNEWKVI